MLSGSVRDGWSSNENCITCHPQKNPVLGRRAGERTGGTTGGRSGERLPGRSDADGEFAGAVAGDVDEMLVGGELVEQRQKLCRFGKQLVVVDPSANCITTSLTPSRS